MAIAQTAVDPSEDGAPPPPADTALRLRQLALMDRYLALSEILAVMSHRVIVLLTGIILVNVVANVAIVYILISIPQVGK